VAWQGTTLLLGIHLKETLTPALADMVLVTWWVRLDLGGSHHPAVHHHNVSVHTDVSKTMLSGKQVPDFPLKLKENTLKNPILAGCQWLTPIILATREAEIKTIKAQGQPRQTVCKTPISKITRTKRTGGVAQVVECLLSKP
jgi:hypothetical protein